jgi:hypothetical protein
MSWFELKKKVSKKMSSSDTSAKDIKEAMDKLLTCTLAESLMFKLGK